MDKCSICGDTIWPWEKHKCDPVWLCMTSDAYPDDDVWTQIRAGTASDAAEVFSAQWDSYNVEYESTKDVIVKDAAGKLFAFEVELDICPEYRAIEKEMEVKVEP